MSFNAKIILDSINPHNGIRLVTTELTYPRFIHAEFMTHRMFSRNAASSRAIPTEKMIDMVTNNPAMPIFWGKNKKGMSPDKEIDIETSAIAQHHWLAAQSDAVEWASKLCKLGVHKQIVNRIIEPWKYITVICTATELSNFFVLRDHSDAQQEIAYLARLWKSCLNDSLPVEREWHIPYVQDDEQSLPLDVRQKIGVARCARVSYLTHDGRRSVDDDIKLYNRLLGGSGHGHWSPFEHVAYATDMMETRFDFVLNKKFTAPIWCGNFHGWIQLRKTFFGECQ